MENSDEPLAAQTSPKKSVKTYPNVMKVQKPQKPKPVSDYHLMEHKITNAIADYKAEKYPSLAEAGRAHGITKGAGYFRLRARASGRASKSDRIINGSQRLSPEQETALCQYIDTLADTRALHRQIRDKAYNMMCENVPPGGSLPKPLGQQWPARFLERHPGILARRPESTISANTASLGAGTDAETGDQGPTGSEKSSDARQILTTRQNPLTEPAFSSDTASDALDAPQNHTEADSGPKSNNVIRDNFLSAIKNSLLEQKMTFQVAPPPT